MKDRSQTIQLFICLALGLRLVSVSLHAADPVTRLHWKNGDVLPGRLLQSPSEQIHWASPQFLENLVVNNDTLAAIIFPATTAETRGDFRVTTTSGDMFTADLQGANETHFVFLNNHFGRFQAGRNSIYSLNRIISPNLVFNGARLDDWNVASAGPIDDLKYKVFQVDANENDILGKDVLLTQEVPVREGRLTGGVIDLSVAGTEGAFAMRFEGQINTPAGGDYEFDLWTGSQARLFVDNELVVDFLNNRRNPEKPAIGIINLREGHHTIRVDYLGHGRSSRLITAITDPSGRNRSLIGMNRDNAIWASGPGGLPQTRRKQAGIFHRIQLPRQVEINLDFAAEDGPRFFMAIGKNSLENAPGKSLRMETWDNELVIVQDELFEPIMTLEEGQKEIRLRLVIDDDAAALRVYDDDGQLLLNMNDIEPSTGDSGIYIRNRGEDLTVRRLSVYRHVEDNQNKPVDGSRARVHMINGQIAYGRLFIEDGTARVVDRDNNRQDIDLSRVDRISHPDVTLDTTDPAVELAYSDGTIIRGRIESANADRVDLQTFFSDALMNCSLDGASALKFETSVSEFGAPRRDQDRFLTEVGQLRGRISYDLPGSPLSWQPDGAPAPLRLSNQVGGRIERGRQNVVRKPTFDDRIFPSVIHLNNGEVIPCRIISYDENTIRFESPFLAGREIASGHIKAIEFDFTRYTNPQDKKPDWLDELLGLTPKNAGIDPVKLERALTIPRFSRQSPPTHILMANNGDMKRGKLLGIDNQSLLFESKMRQLTLPVDRMAKVVRVRSIDGDDDGMNTPETGWHGTVRTLLSDGSVFRFKVENSKNGNLTGRSEIYGDLTLPVEIIQELNIGDFEPENIEQRFKRWVLRPAKEPDFGRRTVPGNSSPQLESSPGQNTSGSKPGTDLKQQQLAAIPAAIDARAVDGQPTNSNAPDLGKVIIDPDQRTLRFPITVNQRSGLVEYALVTEDGKTHESVFRTDAEPTHIHLGLLLLGGKPVYAKQLPPDPSHNLPGDAVQIDITWKEDGNERTRRLGAFMVTINNAQRLRPAPWIYNGSFMSGSGIEAQRDGSIVSLRLDPAALMNNPRPGRMNDELYHANTAALPENTTNLEMVMRLADELAPGPTTESK